MTPEELERRLHELRWKPAPPDLERKVVRVTPRSWTRRLVALGAMAAAAALVVVGLVLHGSGPWGVLQDSRGAVAIEPSVRPPAVLQTGADGLASLMLSDGSRLKLNSNTRLEVDESGWKWRLVAGEIWCDAKPRPSFEISTDAGTARIVGTEFNVRAAGSRTLVAVRHGEVRLSNRLGEVKVPGRHQAQVTADAAPRVVRLANDAQVFGWTRMLKGVRRHAVEKNFAGGEEEGAAGTLEADGAALSLVRHVVRVEIEDDIARTEVEQVFFNNTNRRLEGVFRFPLPKDSSISRFAMTVTGDKLMEGRIVEKQRARQIYESIVRRFEDPGLLEWQEGNQFTARIFPIEPRSEKKTIIAYTQTLPRRDGRAQYTLPLVSDALAANPPKSFVIDVKLRCRGRIVEFESPSHVIDVARRSEGELRASAEASDYAPLNDFVIEYRVDGGLQALRQGDTFLLRLPVEPEGRARVGLGDTLFWLDVSHSTSPSLQEIQYNLMERLLAKLEATDRFNVMLSDVSGRFLFDGFQPASKENRARALSSVWGVETGGATDLGATLELLPAAATVVYVGDGVATLGEREVPALVRKYAVQGRFFAFALGSGVNEMLLEELAAKQGGAVFRLTPGENLARRVDDFAWAVTRPMLTDVRVEIEGAEDVYPKRFASIPKGGELALIGRKKADRIVARVTAGGGFEARHEIDLAAAPENPFLERLWAVRQVRELLATDEGGRFKGAIVALSERYTIMTPYTSLLVLESEEEFKKYRIGDETKGKEEQKKQLAELKEKLEAATHRGDEQAKVRLHAEIDRYVFDQDWDDEEGKADPSRIEPDAFRQRIDRRGLAEPAEEGEQPRIATGLEARRRPTTNNTRAIEPGPSDGRPRPNPSPVPEPARDPMAGDLPAKEAPPENEPSQPAPPRVTTGMPARADAPPPPPRQPDSEGLDKRVEGQSDPSVRKESLRTKKRPGPDSPVSVEQFVGECIKLAETSTDGREQAQALQSLQEVLINGAGVPNPVALEGLQTLLRYRPTLREGWLKLSGVYEQLGDAPAAYRALTTIIEVAPEDPEARRRLAQAFLDTGRADQARGELEQVVRLRPEEPEPYFQLAALAAARDDFAQAERLYTQLLKYNFDERFGQIESRATAALTGLYQKAGATEKLERLSKGRLVFRDVKIVLRWETNATDVDLWVFAPGEEKCSYQQKYTFRGGRLDHDDTDGYGPETYTMPDTRAGKWLVQVEYYNGKGETPGTVEIVLFEGSPRESRRVVSFTLSKEKQVITLLEGELK